MARKVSVVLLVLLGVFLVGTTIVLSTTKAYLKIEDWAYVTEAEVPRSLDRSNDTSKDIVPRILHQTWKTEQLPEKWAPASQHCREMMPDYEYMLWTDASSRALIAEHYPWFLPTFDGYKYKIQRADAIRYFVLHRYGGIYFDLDMGCLRPLDALLKYQVTLPKTIPVGVSNDLMSSTPRHPFMEQVIHALITFDINYILNYPTVMFSTGPMFMSAQYGLYTASHPPTPQNPGGEVRILPKSLYGKNAKPEEAPNSFFEHYYGSSWHSDDAWFITFLGAWGMRLMYVAAVVVAVAAVRMYWQRKKGSKGRRLMFGRYEVILPRFHYDRETGSSHLDLGPFSFARHSRDSSSSSMSPTSSEPASPTVTPRYPSSVIPIPLDVGPSSPTLSSTSSSLPDSQSVAGALRRAGSWVASAITGSPSSPTRRGSAAGRAPRRRRRPRGFLFFLPAIFTPSATSSEEAESLYLPNMATDVEQQRRPRSRSPMPRNKAEEAALESVPLVGGNLDPSSHSSSRRSSVCAPSSVPPPPYVSSRSTTPVPNRTAGRSARDSWESWNPSDASLAR